MITVTVFIVCTVATFLCGYIVGLVSVRKRLDELAEAVDYYETVKDQLEEMVRYYETHYSRHL